MGVGMLRTFAIALIGFLATPAVHAQGANPTLVTSLRGNCEAGNARACFELGLIYNFALGVEQDDRQAVVFYRQACEGGVARGCENLATLTALMDERQVPILERQACEGGNNDSCRRLAYMYLTGSGVERDPAQAFALYRDSCAIGSAPSCSDLGNMYRTGLAPSGQNWDAAYAFFDVAVSLGDSRARSIRDRIAGQMSSEQIAEAQALARQCHERAYQDCDW